MKACIQCGVEIKVVGRGRRCYGCADAYYHTGDVSPRRSHPKATSETCAHDGCDKPRSRLVDGRPNGRFCNRHRAAMTRLKDKSKAHPYDGTVDKFRSKAPPR